MNDDSDGLWNRERMALDGVLVTVQRQKRVSNGTFSHNYDFA